MSKKCPYEKKCGGCQYIDLPYEEQLKKKQKETNKLLSSFGKVKPIIGMKDPWHYRNKVQQETVMETALQEFMRIEATVLFV